MTKPRIVFFSSLMAVTMMIFAGCNSESIDTTEYGEPSGDYQTPGNDGTENSDNHLTKDTLGSTSESMSETDVAETEGYLSYETTASLPEYEVPEELGFSVNLDDYEQYMNPGNTDEYLILVNRENRLTAEYVPQDLTEVAATRDDGRATQYMRYSAAMALEAMFKELRAAGFEDVSVTSGYRSYSYQGSLYNSYVQAHGEEQAKTFSMPVGASEHQTGLCVDMHNLPSADKVFANEPAYEWLRTNCWKFGFILRFPAEKMDVTTIDFEPWHYRYVGRYHARRIYESGMCLEEYIASINTLN